MTGSLVANDLAIAEDPKFGETPFFTAKRFRIGVQMKPLIFNRQLIVRSLRSILPKFISSALGMQHLELLPR